MSFKLHELASLRLCIEITWPLTSPMSDLAADRSGVTQGGTSKLFIIRD